MKLKNYLKDMVLALSLFICSLVLIILMLIVFDCNAQLIIGISAVLISAFCIPLVYDFLRRRTFYNQLNSNLELLDKKYLINEILSAPSFYEGELLCDILYETDKSMNEHVKEYMNNLNDFKEYIEMWIHEVKLPLSALQLIVHGIEDSPQNRILEQLKRIDDDVEQVLYYVRSENAEKDYMISSVSLNRAVSDAALKNKDIFLEKEISLVTENLNISVMTDSKWLSFIINQIMANSIKYMREGTDPQITVSAEETDDCVRLKIRDNGIGISQSDLPKIFDKTFTGANGRRLGTSTGMGLYIVKKLCGKLGHEISAESAEDEFTEITVTFYKNDYFSVVK